MRSLGWGGFGLRFLFALALVMFTYNPSGYSYFHWVDDTLPDINPYIALAGVLLLTGWVIYMRATLRSLGFFGLLLLTAVVACLIWMLVDLDVVDISQGAPMAWLISVLTALVLAVGISWSHIRRRLTGQVDMDDVDEG